MLQSMRKHARYFYVLFFIVILSFVFWGVGTNDQPQTLTVAEIGDEKVTVEEYWRVYERMRETYREIYKGQINEDIEKQLKLKETVLNTLVEEKVLIASAKEMGLTVTDKELQDVIINNPNFMRDGAFRQDVYFKTLELNRLTPDMFEHSLRQQLLSTKVRRLVGSVADVSPLDLKSASGDEKSIEAMKQSILFGKRDMVLKAYINSVKQRMNVKINTNVIS